MEKRKFFRKIYYQPFSRKIAKNEHDLWKTDVVIIDHPQSLRL